MIGDDGYYSLREILGYNAKYNIVLSDRGRGKSWGCKHFLMQQEGTFMCLYRQKPDMKAAIGSWTDPLVESGAYVPTNFEWDGSDEEGWCLKVNGSVKGYFRYLTQVNHIKQEVFPDNLNWVWWDEFIPLVYKKLPGVESEGDALRAIVKTIEHDTVRSREDKGLRPVRVLMFANPFTWNNPILSYFRVIPKVGIWRVGPEIVCELLPPSEQIRKSRKQTIDDFLGDEVNKNQGWADQNAFIEKRTKSSTPEMSLRLGRKFFTVYQMKNGVIKYIIEKDEHSEITKINPMTRKPMLMKWGTLDEIQEDEICLEGTNYLKNLQNMAYRGLLRYDDINCKFDFLNSLQTYI